jgi:hypothetical protein
MSYRPLPVLIASVTSWRVRTKAIKEENLLQCECGLLAVCDIARSRMDFRFQWNSGQPTDTASNALLDRIIAAPILKSFPINTALPVADRTCLF